MNGPLCTLDKIIRRDGVLAGMPMVEIALTPDYADDACIATLPASARNFAPTLKWALVTQRGPVDPLRHNLDALSRAFRQQLFHTALITNGMQAITGKWSWVTLMPNHPEHANGGWQIGAIAAASEIIWRVRSQDDVDALDRFIARGWHQRTCAIVLQPITTHGGNSHRESNELCREAAFTYGYRVGNAVAPYET